MAISYQVINLISTVVKVNTEGFLTLSKLKDVFSENNIDISNSKLLSHLEHYLTIRKIQYTRQSINIEDVRFKGIYIVDQKNNFFFKLLRFLGLLLLLLIFYRTMTNALKQSSKFSLATNITYFEKTLDIPQNDSEKYLDFSHNSYISKKIKNNVLNKTTVTTATIIFLSVYFLPKVYKQIHKFLKNNQRYVNNIHANDMLNNAGHTTRHSHQNILYNATPSSTPRNLADTNGNIVNAEDVIEPINRRISQDIEERNQNGRRT